MSQTNDPPAAGPAPHPSPERLAAFLDGHLAPAERDAIEPHVESCGECCAVLRRLPTDPLAQKLRTANPGPADPDPAAALAGHPRYRLLGPLGSGGMGTVYKARHLLMDRLVALKVVHPRLLRNPRAVERFRREARAAARLSHPNIVTAHDADAAGGCHFLVMEFVEGTSLAALVADRGPLAPAEACGYVRQAAVGLQHAFEHGMVHRDIKPQNLMLTPRGVVKVLDFGLAHVVDDSPDAPAAVADTTEATPAAGLTRASTVLGTPDYMAPEQAADSRAVDTRTDVYALGCTLYFLLSGRPPFPGGTADAKLAAHRDQPPPALAELRSDLPPGLAAVVARMLAKDPAARYQTPAEVAAALRPFAEPPPGRRRRWRRALLAGLAAAALLVAGAVVYANTGNGTLVLDVNEPDARVTIDGREVPFNFPHDEVAAPVGRHALRVEKEGFAPYADEFEIRRRGDRVEISAGLVKLPGGEKPPSPPPSAPPAPPPPLSATVPAELVPTAKRIEAGLPRDPADPEVVALRQELLDYRDRHRGTPEAVHAARVMSRLAWPADALSADRLPAAARTAAGDGHPDQVPAQLVAVFGSRRLMHWSHVNCVALSKDGKTLASAGFDHCVRVWDAATGEPRHVLTGHTNEVLAVAFAPGGDVLASGSADGTVMVWDLAAGRPKYACPHGAWVDSVAFAPDGRVLYSGGRDGRAKRWDITQNGKEMTPIRFLSPGHLRGLDSVFCMALSPDGKTLATGDRDKKVKLWDAATGGEPVTLGEHEAPVWALAFSPDGKTLASGSWDGFAKVWDVPGIRLVHALRSSPPLPRLAAFPGPPIISDPIGVWSVAFAPDNRTLAAGAASGHIYLWDARTGKAGPVLRGQYQPIRGLAFDPDGNTLAAASWDGNVKLWDVATGTDRTPGAGPAAYISAVAVSPDGRSVAAASHDGTVHVWDLATGEGKVVLRCPHAANGVAFSPDGKTLAATCQDGPVRLWDAAAGREGRSLAAVAGMQGVAFSPDGKTLAAVGLNSEVRLWDAARWEPLAAPERHTGGLWAVAFSPDGKTLAVGGWSGTVRLYDTATRVRGHVLQSGEAPVLSLAFSPDGIALLSGGHGPSADEVHGVRTAALLDVATGLSRITASPLEEPRPPTSRIMLSPQFDAQFGARLGSASAVSGVAFSPDGKFFATVGSDGLVRIWGSHDGREKQSIRLGAAPRDIRQVAFTPDSRHVVTANGNGTVYVLRLAPLD